MQDLYDKLKDYDMEQHFSYGHYDVDIIKEDILNIVLEFIEVK